MPDHPGYVRQPASGIDAALPSLYAGARLRDDQIVNVGFDVRPLRIPAVRVRVAVSTSKVPSTSAARNAVVVVVVRLSAIIFSPEGPATCSAIGRVSPSAVCNDDELHFAFPPKKFSWTAPICFHRLPPFRHYPFQEADEGSARDHGGNPYRFGDCVVSLCR
jgi:hypothetical protein